MVGLLLLKVQRACNQIKKSQRCHPSGETNGNFQKLTVFWRENSAIQLLSAFMSACFGWQTCDGIDDGMTSSVVPSSPDWISSLMSARRKSDLWSASEETFVFGDQSTFNVNCFSICSFRFTPSCPRIDSRHSQFFSDSMLRRFIDSGTALRQRTVQKN